MKTRKKEELAALPPAQLPLSSPPMPSNKRRDIVGNNPSNLEIKRLIENVKLNLKAFSCPEECCPGVACPKNGNPEGSFFCDICGYEIFYDGHLAFLISREKSPLFMCYQQLPQHNLQPDDLVEVKIRGSSFQILLPERDAFVTVKELLEHFIPINSAACEELRKCPVPFYLVTDSGAWRLTDDRKLCLIPFRSAVKALVLIQDGNSTEDAHRDKVQEFDVAPLSLQPPDVKKEDLRLHRLVGWCSNLLISLGLWVAILKTVLT